MERGLMAYDVPTLEKYGETSKKLPDLFRKKRPDHKGKKAKPKASCTVSTPVEISSGDDIDVIPPRPKKVKFEPRESDSNNNKRLETYGEIMSYITRQNKVEEKCPEKSPKKTAYEKSIRNMCNSLYDDILLRLNQEYFLDFKSDLCTLVKSYAKSKSPVTIMHYVDSEGNVQIVHQQQQQQIITASCQPQTSTNNTLQHTAVIQPNIQSLQENTPPQPIINVNPRPNTPNIPSNSIQQPPQQVEQQEPQDFLQNNCNATSVLVAEQLDHGAIQDYDDRFEPDLTSTQNKSF